MIEKKSPKGNLEKRKRTFLLIGFVVVIGLVYAAFEFIATKPAPRNLGFLPPFEIVTEEQTTITDPTTSPPPPTAPPEVVILNAVPDDIVLEIDVDIFGQDITQGTVVPEYYPIEMFDVPVEVSPPEYFPDEMPEPVKGFESLYSFLRTNLKYPTIARENDIYGQVFIQFVVEKDGNISSVKVIASVHPALDQEAVRVVQLLPKWKPGKVNGKPVRCYYQIPIRFTIN